MAQNCLIWGVLCEGDNALGRAYFDSPRAGGKYILYVDSMDELYRFSDRITGLGNPEKKWDDKTRARLTTILVEKHRLGDERVEITMEMLEQAENNTNFSIVERANRLLLYLETEFSFGKSIDLQSGGKIEKAMAWSECVHPDEYKNLCAFLKTKNWIKCRTGRGAVNFPQGDGFVEDDTPDKITIEGLIYLEELKRSNLDSSKAFVAMWFDKSMNSVYDKAIKPAIEEMGYKPIRIDRENYNNKIDDEIIANLRTSKFIVADFTYGEGVRGGVYYEAGFAHGLDIPVIFTCRKNMGEKIHFDTRQFNHIFWEDEEDLKKRLIDRIGATIGQGPEEKEDASQA